MRARARITATLIILAMPSLSGAQPPELVPEIPLLGPQAPIGAGLVTSALPNVTPTPKTVDGDIEDWVGTSTRFGATGLYSQGEYVYQDFLFDNYGADDGIDIQRASIFEPLAEAEPRTYRLEAAAQFEGEQGLTGQCGNLRQVPGCAKGYYGNVTDTAVRRETDINQVRVAADDDTLFLLVRTTTMTQPDRTGVLVMFGDDTPPGDLSPVVAGIRSQSRTWLLAAGDQVLESSNITTAEVATNPGTLDGPDEYANAVEIAVPLDEAGTANVPLRIAVATCYIEAGACKSVKSGSGQSDLLNVAFRDDEPARIWMDSRQGFALHDGDIDKYFREIDLVNLQSGANEAFDVRPGYYERIYETDSPVNREADYSGTYFQGRFQHYGVFFPSSYRGRDSGPFPVTWWTHYRGGHAHDAAAWLPGLLRQFGDQKGNIVITPSARGTSTWYVGRGMEDFLDVWDDSDASFPLDLSRVYMSGYSMGGYASWMLPTLMPDRFAGANPQEAPPTQGLFAGPGIATGGQNGGDVQAQLTYNILENARNLAYVIYQGTNDELVPISGNATMHAKLISLGYDNRMYTIAGGDHFSVAFLDHWTEAADYLNQFRRDQDPPRVTYRTWPAMERAVSTVSVPTGMNLGYRFNKAYWVSNLEARTVRDSGGKPHPADWGTIDATSYGRGVPQTVGVPETGTGIQGTPYVMTGLRNHGVGQVAPRNEFTATLTNLSQARLDLGRMAISTSSAITGSITTDGATEVLLTGSWSSAPTVAFAGSAGSASLSGNTLTLSFAGAGSTTVTIS